MWRHLRSTRGLMLVIALLCPCLAAPPQVSRDPKIPGIWWGRVGAMSNGWTHSYDVIAYGYGRHGIYPAACISYHESRLWWGMNPKDNGGIPVKEIPVGNFVCFALGLLLPQVVRAILDRRRARLGRDT